MPTPIKGYTDGLDYEIAAKMCELYAERQGWSRSVKRKPSRCFEYELIMSRYGKKDSNNPVESIGVGYSCGSKAVEIWRHGRWSAVVCIDKDGQISSGQFQYEQGIDDLMLLRQLHKEVMKNDKA